MTAAYYERMVSFTELPFCVESTVCFTVIVTKFVTILSHTTAVAMLCLQKCIFHVCKRIVVLQPTTYLEAHIPVRLHLGSSFPFVSLLSCQECRGNYVSLHSPYGVS
uniref:Uncharacterized protein n=1 Tax=Rhipicephalus microplus TaxID=6941 RepID=A0A6G5AG72_RHIMP